MRNKNSSRRAFIKSSSVLLASIAAWPSFGLSPQKAAHKISAHLWIYASGFPPDWNCGPVLETVFSELKYAGLDGVELMDVNLRDPKDIDRLKELSEEYNLPVTGTSYGTNMWDKKNHQSILEDVGKVTANLRRLGGTTFGISVGSAGRMKSEKELDDQADLLQSINKICKSNDIVPNLHNHTYEVENDLHDLRGTLERIPDFPLGPDVGWLAKAGVDPVEFVRSYGKQIVYLHLRDIDDRGEWTEVPGEGTIDFDGVAAALHETGFFGPVAIELAFPSEFKPTRELKESWKISRAFINKSFNEVN